MLPKPQSIYTQCPNQTHCNKIPATSTLYIDTKRNSFVRDGLSESHCYLEKDLGPIWYHYGRGFPAQQHRKVVEGRRIFVGQPES